MDGSSGRRDSHSRRDGEKGIADREEDVWDVEECVKKDGRELSCQGICACYAILVRYMHLDHQR